VSERERERESVCVCACGWVVCYVYFYLKIKCIHIYTFPSTPGCRPLATISIIHSLFIIGMVKSQIFNALQKIIFNIYVFGRRVGLLLDAIDL